MTSEQNQQWAQLARVIAREAADLTSDDELVRRAAIATLSQAVHTARMMDPDADSNPAISRMWMRAEHRDRYATPVTV